MLTASELQAVRGQGGSRGLSQVAAPTLPAGCARWRRYKQADARLRCLHKGRYRHSVFGLTPLGSIGVNNCRAGRGRKHRSKEDESSLCHMSVRHLQSEINVKTSFPECQSATGYVVVAHLPNPDRLSRRVRAMVPAPAPSQCSFPKQRNEARHVPRRYPAIGLFGVRLPRPNASQRGSLAVPMATLRCRSALRMRCSTSLGGQAPEVSFAHVGGRSKIDSAGCVGRQCLSADGKPVN